MKKFISFLANGQITSVNTCIDSDFPLQSGYPDSVLEVNFDIDVGWNTHYVELGELKNKPIKPDSNYVFNYVTKAWEPDSSIALAAVKSKRNDLLFASDWIVTRAMDVGTPVPEDWRVYRQALRDITLQPDIFNIIWPTAPQG